MNIESMEPVAEHQSAVQQIFKALFPVPGALKTISDQDGKHHINLLDRFQEQLHTLCMRVELLGRPSLESPATGRRRWGGRSAIHLFIVALVSMVVPGCPVRAATPATSAPHTTFIVFADHHMPEAQWDDLLVALHRGLAASEQNAQRPASVEILRGDAIAPGLELDQIVTVYLHGDCVLLPSERVTVTGALGWVYLVHGQIPPFIHVDCGELSQILGPMALILTPNRRHQIMAEAMARVVLHEWVHVATQRATHAHDGIAKSSFGIADLLADDDEYRRNPARFSERRWPLL